MGLHSLPQPKTSMKRVLKVLGGLVLLSASALLAAKIALARPSINDGSRPAGYASTHAMMAAYALKELKLVDLNPPLPAGVVERKDIEYGKVGQRALLLDLFSPVPTPKNAPGLIFIHGGGWKGGRRQDYRVYTTHFAKLGYVVATISYRLVPEAPFPACVQDAKNAVRWMRAQAGSLGIDAQHIAVIGGSAGGHLAMMVGYSSDLKELEGNGGYPEVSSSVSAVVNFYGPADLTTPFAIASGLVKELLDGKSFEQAPELYRQASPMAHLQQGAPPTLIFHGTLDEIVPIDQADSLSAKLKSLNVPHEYGRMEGWPHTMDAAQAVNAYAKRKMEAFLLKHLGPLTP